MRRDEGFSRGGGGVPVLFVAGTRPELVKLAPLVAGARAGGALRPLLCLTGQHGALLDPLLDLFGLVPDIDLRDGARVPRSLAASTADLLDGLDRVLARARPAMLVCQGDTVTSLAAALAGACHRIPVGHVEAGLRSHDRAAPWPEETGRRMIADAADLHFAPNRRARDNLLFEGIAADAIHVTGNTGIDSLLALRDRLATEDCRDLMEAYGRPDPGRRLVLVTAHRRESFGAGLAGIAGAVAALARRGDVRVLCALHTHPEARRPFLAALDGVEGVRLVEPPDYRAFVWLMLHSHFILSDSGGVQEDAPALGRPLLVPRHRTERPEAVACGAARLVGTDGARILAEANRLLDDPAHHARMSRVAMPFGDGRAAGRILDILARHLTEPAADLRSCRATLRPGP